MFAVNPFGVQSDGALVETGATRGGNGFSNAVARRETADLSPDYVYDSKGRLTDYGYEVEVRIPFKSLRYQSAAEQSWGLNVTRRVQHSGYEDSWTPARRASASFLAQSGRLVGLTDLHRGLVRRLHAFGHLAHHRPPGRTTERGTTAAAPRSWAARSAGASPTT